MSLKTLLMLIAPGALTLSAAGMLLLFQPTAPALLQAARGYPIVALAVAAVLAWRMHRSRLLLTALLLLAAHLALRIDTLGGDTAVTTLAALLLPLLIAALAASADRSVATRYTLLQALLVAFPVTAAIVVLLAEPAAARAFLTRDVIDPIYTDWLGLRQSAIVAALFGLGTVMIIALRSERPADAGMGWAALGGVLALAAPAGSTGRSIWLLAAGLILIIALVESSYIMAFHDELTGLPGRRALSQALAALRPPYSVAVVDIDHFKTFNDRHGHDVGDQVLRMVAARLARVRDGTAYRSGGEEFTVVFPALTKPDAANRMEEVRAAVAAEKFTLRSRDRRRKEGRAARRGRAPAKDRKLGVTISVGLAAPDPRSPIDTVVKAADKAMYRAKQGGRNRVVA